MSAVLVRRKWRRLRGLFMGVYLVWNSLLRMRA
jgi:hypothetical protein